MAKENPVQIVEKNEGTKIEFEQSGKKLFFGDDEIMVNAAKYQREYPVHLDVCANKDKNLVIGVGEGTYYVAQVDIPAIEYTETETEGETTREALPLDMGDVIVTLWSIDDLTPANT